MHVAGSKGDKGEKVNIFTYINIISLSSIRTQLNRKFYWQIQTVTIFRYKHVYTVMVVT